MTVSNLSRSEARNFSNPGNYIWISIGEPCNRDKSEFQHIYNEILETGPTLKIKFWDLCQKIVIIGEEEYLDPPAPPDAKKIVDFILDNPGKDIIVNCAAGVSRSSAVSCFCQDLLGFEWINGKSRAVPNMHLYKLMRDYYTDPSTPIYHC